LETLTGARAPLDDAQLVQRIAAAPGESAADEAELCRRYLQRIRLYGRRHLRDETATADLVQEVIAAVIEAVRAGRVEQPDRIAQFVLGTCRFVAWRMRQGEWRRGETAVRAQLELPVAIEPVEARSIDAGRLEQCLGGLPSRDKQIIYLSFCEDRSAQEIGAALALSEGNVRVLRHRALARLRTCVDGGGR
jgi:RNA polymerase sigma-70 factor (ECF subfamily)